MKNNSGKFVFAVIVIVTVLLGLYSFKSNKEIKDTVPSKFSFNFFEDSESSGVNINSLRKGKGNYIAVINIEGIIEKQNQFYNQKWLLSTIQNLSEDPENRGIILFIDSPGGAVYEADEAYLALCNYAAQKPVWAYLASIAASGGYYIACSAEKIYANRNTLTGSIGVIAGQSVDATGLLDKLGLKSKTITAGKNKNMGNFNQPLTEEQEAIMQSIADECYQQFTEIVAHSRNLPIDKVKELADGRIYTANQAKNNGLIDGCKTNLDAVITLMEEEYNEAKEFEVIYCKPDYKPKLREILKGAKSAVDKVTGIAKSGTINVSTPMYIYK